MPRTEVAQLCICDRLRWEYTGPVANPEPPGNLTVMAIKRIGGRIHSVQVLWDEGMRRWEDFSDDGFWQYVTRIPVTV